MKITKNIILIICSAIYITTYLFGNNYRQEVVYLQQISLFIVIGILVFNLTNLIAKDTIKKFELTSTKETIVQVLKITVFAGVLIGTSMYQVGFINYTNNPQIKGCVQYDDYGNMIYVSEYYNQCGDVTVIEKTDKKLVFEVTETIKAKFDNFVFDTAEDIKYEVIFQTDILTTKIIDYNENHKITRAEVKKTTVTNIESETRESSNLTSSITMYENTYKPTFEQVVTTTLMPIQESTKTNTFNLVHADFTNGSQTITRYYQVDVSEDTYEIYKEFTEEEELKTELYATIQRNNDDFVISGSWSGYYDYDATYRIKRSIETIEVHENNEFTEYSNKVITTYNKHSDFGYLITQMQTQVLDEIETRNNIIKYWFLESVHATYYVSSFDTDSKNYNLDIGDKYYVLEKSDIGIVSKYVGFVEISYLEYLLNDQEYDDNYMIYRRAFLGGMSEHHIDTFGFFLYEGMIYQEPLYLN